jgi:hypothetical protein
VEDAAQTADWDPQAFRDGVTRTLADGSFLLVILVDEINDELGRIIRFMNGCGKPAFSFSALEMRQFHSGSEDILVPHLYRGMPAGPIQAGGGERRKWSEQSFFEATAELRNPGVESLIKELYDWSKQTADVVQFGTGAKIGSFTFAYLKDEYISVFTVTAYGRLVINFGSLNYESARLHVPKNAVESFHEELHRIPGFRHIAPDKWPSVTIQEAFVNQAEALENFKNAVRRLGEKVRGGVAHQPL